MGFGIPITIRGWDFFLKLGLKDNLGFVWLIGEGGVIMDWLFLAFGGFYGVICCCVGFSSLFGSLGVPITIGSKSCGFGKGVGCPIFN